jgi:predicted peroxiredoxin
VTEDQASKTIIMCNHDDANSILAALVMAAAAAATGEQVLMFFQPGAAKLLAKGELEKYQDLKGQPDPIMLYESIMVLDGRIILCELGLPIHDIKEEDLREGVEIMMASSFLFEAEGANMIFSY